MQFQKRVASTLFLGPGTPKFGKLLSDKLVLLPMEFNDQ